LIRFARSLVNLLGFLLVLTAVIILMQRTGMIDLGTGNAQVIDGDSLRLNGTEIRLHGIDAPEYRQACEDASGLSYPCGKQAAAALRGILRGRDVACSSIETDRYGRAVSTCKIGEEDIARDMVQQGWAVAYVRHGSGYVGDEAQARKARRGIWSGRFEIPENYRARMRRVYGGLVNGAARED
jgi:endonuclease YncB( thermonuclease family)